MGHSDAWMRRDWQSLFCKMHNEMAEGNQAHNKTYRSTCISSIKNKYHQWPRWRCIDFLQSTILGKTPSLYRTSSAPFFGTEYGAFSTSELILGIRSTGTVTCIIYCIENWGSISNKGEYHIRSQNSLQMVVSFIFLDSSKSKNTMMASCFNTCNWFFMRVLPICRAHQWKAPWCRSVVGLVWPA